MTTRSEPDTVKDVLVETIRHEENLINTRLTWMLTFQGFLFAAASLAADETGKAMLDVVPWVGISVSALSFLGVVAAYGTIDAARKASEGSAWKYEQATGSVYTSDPATAARSRFGGSRWRKVLGRTNSLGIPVVVVIAWLVLYLKLQ